MGLFDTVILEEGVDLPEWDYDTPPSEVDWQTKSIGHPSMQTYKITEDGRLLRKEVEREEITDEERQERAEKYDYESWEEMEEDAPILALNTTKVVDEWWADHNQHGSFQFYATHPREKTEDGVEGTRHTYEAVFRKGELKDIALINRHEL